MTCDVAFFVNFLCLTECYCLNSGRLLTYAFHNVYDSIKNCNFQFSNINTVYNRREKFFKSSFSIKKGNNDSPVSISFIVKHNNT